MGKWFQVYLVVLAAILPSLAFAGEDELIRIGRTGKVQSTREAPARVSGARTSVRTRRVPVAPRFSVSIGGSEADLFRDAFADYARSFGQPVKLNGDSTDLRVELDEDVGYDRSTWGNLAQSIGRRAGIDISADARERVTLRARVFRGDEFIVSIPASKTVTDVRIEGQAWSLGTFANFGREIRPEDATRANLVLQLVPKVMAELQQQAIAEAAESAEAEETEAEADPDPDELVSDPPPARRQVAPSRASRPVVAKKTTVQTELLLDGGSKMFPGRVRPGDKLKIMKAGRKVGEIWCAFGARDGAAAGMFGDTNLALRPGTTLRR